MEKEKRVREIFNEISVNNPEANEIILFLDNKLNGWIDEAKSTYSLVYTDVPKIEAISGFESCQAINGTKVHLKYIDIDNSNDYIAFNKI